MQPEDPLAIHLTHAQLRAISKGKFLIEWLGDTDIELQKFIVHDLRERRIGEAIPVGVASSIPEAFRHINRRLEENAREKKARDLRRSRDPKERLIGILMDISVGGISFYEGYASAKAEEILKEFTLSMAFWTTGIFVAER